MKILLAEDNEINRDVEYRMLRKLGVEVDAVADGLEAIEELKRNRYDLVFLDWQMPGLDGEQTVRKIRDEIPGGDRIIVIGISGHALPGDREVFLKSGFDDYLAKPIRIVDFQGILARWGNGFKAIL